MTIGGIGYMAELLKTLGDDAFAQALEFERLEIRSAVGDFLQKEPLKAAPKTLALIKAAPQIEFPLDQSNRDESKSPLLQRFIRYEKEHPGQ